MTSQDALRFTNALHPKFQLGGCDALMRHFEIARASQACIHNYYQDLSILEKSGQTQSMYV